MPSKKSIRNRGMKTKVKTIHLEMTSLLDIITILLAFLLQSYNNSGVIIDVPKGIEIPKSSSKELNNFGVQVQVSPTTIWVDQKVIYDINNTANVNIYDQDRLRIIPLYNELVQKKMYSEQIRKATPAGVEFSGVVNLIMDKSLKFNYIKKVLHTLAEAGYKKYKFVVMSDQY